jgi:hypothetical protein
VLLVDFAAFFARSAIAKYIGVSEVAILVVALAINFIACALIGVAAKQLGRSWLLYGLLPAAVLMPPGALFSYYKLRSSARLQWLDSHATYVKDGV